MKSIAVLQALYQSNLRSCRYQKKSPQRSKHLRVRGLLFHSQFYGVYLSACAQAPPIVLFECKMRFGRHF